eukprot:TRINITY_DN12946_c0_g1_i3.p1 TRINITY_DN12946_c0_g1~~TRINITY_DN12946_c0_g1_i3.p1  ORF type:complete len:1391 (+),score=391.16 TRINITY_DN12946_c0_g1_i3:154-4326(+)
MKMHGLSKVAASGPQDVSASMATSRALQSLSLAAGELSTMETDQMEIMGQLGQLRAAIAEGTRLGLQHRQRQLALSSHLSSSPLALHQSSQSSPSSSSKPRQSRSVHGHTRRTLEQGAASPPSSHHHKQRRHRRRTDHAHSSSPSRSRPEGSDNAASSELQVRLESEQAQMRTMQEEAQQLYMQLRRQKDDAEAERRRGALLEEQVRLLQKWQVPLPTSAAGLSSRSAEQTTGAEMQLGGSPVDRPAPPAPQQLSMDVGANWQRAPSVQQDFWQQGCAISAEPELHAASQRWQSAAPSLQVPLRTAMQNQSAPWQERWQQQYQLPCQLQQHQPGPLPGYQHLQAQRGTQPVLPSVLPLWSELGLQRPDALPSALPTQQASQQVVLRAPTQGFQQSAFGAQSYAAPSMATQGLHNQQQRGPQLQMGWSSTGPQCSLEATAFEEGRGRAAHCHASWLPQGSSRIEAWPLAAGGYRSPEPKPQQQPSYSLQSLAASTAASPGQLLPVPVASTHGASEVEERSPPGDSPMIEDIASSLGTGPSQPAMPDRGGTGAFSMGSSAQKEELHMLKQELAELRASAAFSSQGGFLNEAAPGGSPPAQVVTLQELRQLKEELIEASHEPAGQSSACSAPESSEALLILGENEPVRSGRRHTADVVHIDRLLLDTCVGSAARRHSLSAMVQQPLPAVTDELLLCGAAAPSSSRSHAGATTLQHGAAASVPALPPPGAHADRQPAWARDDAHDSLREELAKHLFELSSLAQSQEGGSSSAVSPAHHGGAPSGRAGAIAAAAVAAAMAAADQDAESLLDAQMELKAFAAEAEELRGELGQKAEAEEKACHAEAIALQHEHAVAEQRRALEGQFTKLQELVELPEHLLLRQIRDLESQLQQQASKLSMEINTANTRVEFVRNETAALLMQGKMQLETAAVEVEIERAFKEEYEEQTGKLRHEHLEAEARLCDHELASGSAEAQHKEMHHNLQNQHHQALEDIEDLQGGLKQATEREQALLNDAQRTAEALVLMGQQVQEEKTANEDLQHKLEHLTTRAPPELLWQLREVWQSLEVQRNAADGPLFSTQAQIRELRTELEHLGSALQDAAGALDSECRRCEELTQLTQSWEAQAEMRAMKAELQQHQSLAVSELRASRELLTFSQVRALEEGRLAKTRGELAALRAEMRQDVRTEALAMASVRAAAAAGHDERQDSLFGLRSPGGHSADSPIHLSGGQFFVTQASNPPRLVLPPPSPTAADAREVHLPAESPSPAGRSEGMLPLSPGFGGGPPSASASTIPTIAPATVSSAHRLLSPGTSAQKLPSPGGSPFQAMGQVSVLSSDRNSSGLSLRGRSLIEELQAHHKATQELLSPARLMDDLASPSLCDFQGSSNSVSGAGLSLAS